MKKFSCGKIGPDLRNRPEQTLERVAKPLTWAFVVNGGRYTAPASGAGCAGSNPAGGTNAICRNGEYFLLRHKGYPAWYFLRHSGGSNADPK